MVGIRPARAGEGQQLYDVTEAAITGLASGHYSAAQIQHWMGGRDAGFYERVIAEGGVCAAVKGAEVLGFVDTKPGVILRLYVRPAAAGLGLGGRLLKVGVAAALLRGTVSLEATLNAVPFYRRCGFVAVGPGVYRQDSGLPVDVVNMVYYAPV